MNFKFEKKEEQTRIEQIKKDAEQQARYDRQRFVIILITGGLLLLLAITILIYRNLRIKKQANIQLHLQKTEIEQKNVLLELQKKEIEHKNRDITDSIRYALRIQEAIIPSTKIIEQIIPEYFVLFKPRDIVSGDFYWLKQIRESIIFTVADCTGHGVPGAFMSMLGMSLLNEITNRPDILHANEILNELRAGIIKSLHQTGRDAEAKDGMDMALCIIDLENNTMQYAGAYNSLFLIRNGELIEYKADSMPIGIDHRVQSSFTNKEIKLEKDDSIYIYSDGYKDQLGGIHHKKYLAKNFKTLLVSVQSEPMSKQKLILNSTIEEWRGNEQQIDDICVLGVKIPEKFNFYLQEED